MFDLMADQKLSMPQPVKNGALTDTQGKTDSVHTQKRVLSFVVVKHHFLPSVCIHGCSSHIFCLKLSVLP